MWWKSYKLSLWTVWKDDHGQTIKNEVKSFKCVDCCLDFKTRAVLNMHAIEIHNDIDRECEQYGKFFVWGRS